MTGRPLNSGPASAARPPLGVTLVEMVVAMAMLTVLVAMAFEISMKTTRSASEIISTMDLEVKGERTLKVMMEALTPATNLTVDTAGFSWISFFVPVDGTGGTYNGTPLKVDGTLEFGTFTDVADGRSSTPEIDGWPGVPTRFYFVKNRELNEATEGVDLNSDGDMDDVFDVGHIEQYSGGPSGTPAPVPGDYPRQMGVANIIQRCGAWGTSILTDGGTDDSGRIFHISTDAVLTMNLYLLTVSEDRMPHLVNSRARVFLRNQVP